jgi:hypothetical protein
MFGNKRPTKPEIIRSLQNKSDRDIEVLDGITKSNVSGLGPELQKHLRDVSYVSIILVKER